MTDMLCATVSPVVLIRYISYEYNHDPNQDTHWVMWIYHCFAIIWFASFVVSASDFIVSGVTSHWYFMEETDVALRSVQGQFMAFKESVKMIYTLGRYHIGTVAAASVFTIFSWLTLHVLVPIQSFVGKIPVLGDSIGFGTLAWTW